MAVSPPHCSHNSRDDGCGLGWLFWQSGDVELDELRANMFLLRDADATAHLLRVSAGLDSLVLGEGQILSQVRRV